MIPKFVKYHYHMHPSCVCGYLVSPDVKLHLLNMK